ncbi:hypothetical protein ACQEVF_37865 [Nonomuraea polychroma]
MKASTLVTLAVPAIGAATIVLSFVIRPDGPPASCSSTAPDAE